MSAADDPPGEAPATAARAPRAGWIGLGVALAALAALVARTDFLIDDAFISFRYARNWAETGTPTYNPGWEPVEGYSNFLWVALLRVAYGLGVPLEIAARVVSVACGATLVALFHRHLCRELLLSPTVAGIGAVLLAASPPFAVWCTGGLETSLFALLLFGAYASLSSEAGNELSRGLVAGACGLGVALTRVEGFVWVLGIAAAAWAVDATRSGSATPGGSDGRHRRRLGAFFTVYLVGFAAFLLWRHATYGEWLANTVHAKAGLSGEVLARGLRTTASYLVLFVTPLLALALLPIALRGPRRGAAVGSVVLFAGFLAYNTVVGGDWMPFFRFLAPATPFVALIVALALDRIASRHGLGALAIGLAALALQLLPAFGASAAPRSLREALYFRTFRTGYQTELERWRTGVTNLESFEVIGRGLAQIAKPGESITFGAIGAIGWHSGLLVHDRNGLVDREVARREVVTRERSAGHDKRVPRSFFVTRKPTFFHAAFVPDVLDGLATVGGMNAVHSAASWVFRDGDEEALKEACLPELHVLEATDDVPTGTLIVLRWTDSPQDARSFWGRLFPE